MEGNQSMFRSHMMLLISLSLSPPSALESMDMSFCKNKKKKCSEGEIQGGVKSRFTVVSTWNIEFMFVLFTNYCIIFPTKGYIFATPYRFVEKGECSAGMLTLKHIAYKYFLSIWEHPCSESSTVFSKMFLVLCSLRGVIPSSPLTKG